MVCGWFRPAPFCSGVVDTSGCLFCAFTRCSMLITDPEQSLRQAPYFKCTAKYALLTNTMTGTSWACRDIRGSALAFSFVAICPGSFVRLGGSWLMSPVTFSHVQSSSSIPDVFFWTRFHTIMLFKGFWPPSCLKRRSFKLNNLGWISEAVIM